MDQAQPTTMARNRRAALVATLLAAIIALGAYLRLGDLGSPGLWFDEGITLEQSTRPNLVESVKASTTHPPLTRLMVRASVALAGSDRPGDMDFAVRLPSAFMGTLAILLIFLLARRLAQGDDFVGLVAAGIYALLPFGVYYSQEARYYSGLVLFAAWAYHGALLLGEHPRALGRQLYLFAGLALGLFNHHFGAAPYLTSFLLVLPAIWASPRRSWVAILPWVASGAAFLPWLAFAFGNLESQARPWILGMGPQLRELLAGWLTGRVGFYHLAKANWGQPLGLTVAVSSGLLLGLGLVVHAVLRRKGHALWAVVAFLGPLLGAAILHDLTSSTRFFHHKYLAFLYPLVALFLAELFVLLPRAVYRLAIWPALVGLLLGRRERPRLWHIDLLVTAGVGLLLAFLVVVGPTALRGTLEAMERQRWGSPTYLPREHYQEVARWIQARRGPDAVIMVFDPHERMNNVWLLRYYGVEEPILLVSDFLSRRPHAMSPEMRRAIDRANEVFVVTAHASPEDHQRTVALVRRPDLSASQEFFGDGAEGKTLGVHLGKVR
ncbi:MAG: glycosyltransferase family 39 protein [Polyangia bacterium]|nr:glycosyltransferase family 39 protein [Polyangia bacterium]